MQRRIEVQLVWVPYLLLGAMFVSRGEGWDRLQREIDIVERENQTQLNRYYMNVASWSAW